MKGPRPIGELIRPIMERAAEYVGIQGILGAMDTDAERKTAIIDWWGRGLITPEDAELLISSHMLEEA